MNKYVKLIITFSIVMLTSCIYIGMKKMMWVDELFSFYSTQDSSLPHALEGIASGINASPPFYFLITWTMYQLGIHDIILFRIFSSTCFILSLFLLWKALRKYVGAGRSAIALLLVYGGSNWIFLMNLEFRYYGLFFFLTSLALVQALALSRNPRNPGRLFLFGLCIGLSCLTHVFGIFYAVAFFASFFIHSLYTKKYLLQPMLAVIAGSSLLLFWTKQLMLQASTGKPHSWIPRPDVSALNQVFISLLPYIKVVGFHYKIFLLLFLILWIVYFITRKYFHQRLVIQRQAFTAEKLFLVILGLCLILIPLLVAYFISRQFISIFHERYFIPSLLGVVLLLSAALSAIRINAPKLGYILGILICILGVIRLIQFTRTYEDPLVPVFSGIEKQLKTEKPTIVFESAIYFLPFQFYYPGYESLFPLDWEVALLKNNTLHATTDFKLMSSMKLFYHVQGIYPSREIFQQRKSFYVADEQSETWLEYYVDKGMILPSSSTIITPEVSLKKISTKQP